jgi:type I site-specific restriction endonuclease
MISSYPNLDKLVEDVLTRIMVDNGEINETVIFANGTDEADDIADKINIQY